MSSRSFASLRQEVIGCRLCPRLVQFRESVPVRAGYQGQPYWRRPVPGYGDEEGWLLITGLAPAPQGGNRTGRIFTGDLTARFLMNALHRAGFANQPFSESADDGLLLRGCYLTAAVKCVPPENRPTRQETLTCRPYYLNELRLLNNLSAILALGHIAFNAAVESLKMFGAPIGTLRFAHGAKFSIESYPHIYCSYHPSPRNVNTGTLTTEMFSEVFQQIREDHDQDTKKRV